MTTFDSLIFVRNELEKLSLHGVSVEISEIRTEKELTPSEYGMLRDVLHQAGVELFEDKRDILMQRIKNVIMEIVYRSEEQLVYNLSTYLTEELHHDYTYMSNLFSVTQHITIERFYICHKIERVKELLLYENMTVTEIAYKMHYSSLAHLSNQFRKVTGMTTSQFKQQHRMRLPPENR